VILLGVDTVTDSGGVGLLVGERTMSRDLGERGRHAETLIPAAVSLLGEAGIAWSALDGIAVNVGPGSFTGIRVGLAAALGWGEAGSIPVGGVGCLDIQAWACYHAKLPPVGAYMISVIDVRRGEVMWSGFRIADTGPVAAEPERLVSVAEPGPEPEPGTWVSGHGAALLWPGRSDLARFEPTGPDRAIAAARLGARGMAEGGFAPAEPRYARPADAKPRRRP
jgi:tRNA threonylcarbamoyladenosine biosynthesis protein TsaB